MSWGLMVDLSTLEAFALADPNYFEHPRHLDPQDTRVQLEMPPGWTTSASGNWIHHRPAEAVLPEQGWKLHIAATSLTLAETTRIAAEHCIRENVAFKHLASGRLALVMNGKYAPRTSSGKCITIYPTQRSQLISLARALNLDLAHLHAAPHILTDHRVDNGPVFVRYGAFRPLLCVDADGTETEAIRTPDGTLTPDRRSLAPKAPPWSPLPSELARDENDADADADALDAFEGISALHFSNGGGVYRAKRRSDGASVILKEGRPNAGYDGLDDARTRIDREAASLIALAGTPGVPALLARFTAGTHRFLVREYLPGMTLTRWVSSHHPAVSAEPSPSDLATYLDQCRALHEQLRQVIDAIHAGGIVYRDLHPHNVLVDDDGTVNLIDFELAVPLENADPAPIGAAPFRAPASARGELIDKFALDSLFIWMLVPYASATRWVTSAEVVERADSWYSLEPEDQARIARWSASVQAPRNALVTPTAPLSDESGEVNCGAVDDVIDAAWQSVLRSATPLRADRLFPGHPTANAAEAVSLAAGASGILFAAEQGGLPLDDSVAEWVIARIAQLPVAPAGLWNGLDGAALVLAQAGHTDAVEHILRRTRPLHADHRSSSYADGLSGIALALSRIASLTQDADLQARADRMAEHVISRSLHTKTDPAQAGILHGNSGLALLATELHARTGERWLLVAANEFLRRDLSLCVRTRSGSLQPVSSGVHYPYLGNGSVGIALAAMQLPETGLDEDLQTALPSLARAALSRFVIEPGLIRGRAGLLAAAHLLGEREAVAQHLEELPLHLVPGPAGLSVPSMGLLRLSSDFATGATGLAHALRAIRGAVTELIPGVWCDPSAGSSHSLSSSDRKEVKHGEGTQPSDAARIAR